MNTLLLNQIVTPFLSQNFDNYQVVNNYSINNNAIEIHNQPTVFMQKNNVFIQLVSDKKLTIDLLNCFEGISAIAKYNDIFINGIMWDGKKTNLNLFY